MVHFSGVTKNYGNKTLYRNGSFQINPGEKIGLVGPNGAGKTTIFRLIAGEERPDEGTITCPDKLRVGYFSQNIEEMKGRSVLDEVKSAIPSYLHTKTQLSELELKLSEDLSEEQMTKVLEKYGELQAKFEEIGGYDVDSRVAEILTGLGIAPDEQHRMTESFSGGWKMRIALAKILAIQPEVLLMDEPTNHLDLESIVWLESWIVNYKGSLLMTSHDRDFMNRIVSKIVEVANKTITV
ncbi:MAG: ATP-binding cassette domain-containing protein, partial [Bdellovibrionota bacterium]